MSRNGPLITLLAGGALGVGLLVAGMAATPAEPVADDAQDVGSTQTPATSAPPTESAKPSPSVAAPEPEVSEGTPEPASYVGYVDGEYASVAVVIDGAEAVAYVCDGASLEVWLKGTAADGRVELTGDRGTLSATYDESAVTGEVTADGLTWTFDVAQVAPPDGLYRFADTVSGAEVVGGWIVLPDGSQVGAVNIDGETQPADGLDPATGQVMIEGTAVTAELQVDGSFDEPGE